MCAGCTGAVEIHDGSSDVAPLQHRHDELLREYKKLAWRYDRLCETMAGDYRCGRYNRVIFDYMADYFQRRLGKMTTAELKGLLGEPRVLSPDDPYYVDALCGVYYPDRAQQPETVPHDRHDRVLHYGENGPPEHSIPDESQNLFFVVKDGIVISMWGLYP